MRMRRSSVGILALASAASILAASAAVAVPPKPAISMQTARAKALAVARGQVKSAELETENGRLVYSFDIQKPRTAGIEEIQVGALSGRIVSVKHESPAQERAEAKADAQSRKPR